MADSRCLLPVCHGGGDDTKFGERGINRLISSAKARGNGDLQTKLQDIINDGGDAASIVCHKGCYCTYTSKFKIERRKKSQKRKAGDEGGRVTTRSHNQTTGVFDYKRVCMFCGDECLPVDERHPQRWDRVRECLTKERFVKEHNPLPTLQDGILDVAEQRNDDIARKVKLHIAFVYDLPSAECKYHVRCYNSFMKIPKYADLPTGSVDENALKQVIECMNQDSSRIWNSVELHSLYSDLGGELCRRDMFRKLTDCMSKDVIIVRVDECASIVGYRECIAKCLKVVSVTDTDETSIDSVVRQIRKEARSVKYNSANYDLSEFTKANTIKATSSTLLKLISDQVSGGEVTKKSLSLSQSIQSHVTGTRNQTTLGLAVKLQHRHGSSELLRLLHEHGFTTSYDEVLRFRKSTAHFLGDNAQLLHRFMGLCRTVGVIFAWFDNLDLHVFTPNGRRTTHVLSHELQQPHPAGILEYGHAQPGKSSLIIPRLSKKAAQSMTSSSSSGSLPLQHYTRSTKVKPPAVDVTSGISYEEASDRQASLTTAQEKDMNWLNMLNTNENAMEWGGFNNQEARYDPAQMKPASTYMFGPLIDAKASDPDTVLTSLQYLKTSLADMGMSYVHISVDMQLYMVACQIKWNDIDRFKNIILRPGIMHTVQSFCGCIGKLMCGSGNPNPNPSLIDEYGRLRKGSKAPLAHKLCMPTLQPTPADVTIVDVSQLLYHLGWPFRGDASVLVESIKTRLSSLTGDKVLVFDKYHDVSAKDHERMRRDGLGSICYDLTINTPLPSRYAIMRNKHNKLQLSKVLSTFSFGEGVTLESHTDGVFAHDEADITIISFLLMAAESDTRVIRILSDDTDVFVLLAYFVYAHNIQATVQMELWNGTVWDINATCAQLGPKCLQILGMHYLTGSDTTSYLYGKGKVSTLKTLRAGDFPGLYSALVELDAANAQLMEAGQAFFCALYGKRQETTMSDARYRLYTRKSGKLLKLMSLPPTEDNLFLHILRAHLQTILAKSADQQAPPELDITKYGWDIKEDIPAPAISDQPPGPKDLMDVVRCGCKAEGKACSTGSCSCHHGKISHALCTAYVHAVTASLTHSRD